MSDHSRSTTPEVFDARAPFDKSTADVILRSSDSVDFHVCKAILAEACAFFEDAFSLPPEDADDDDDEFLYKGDVPVVEVEESSRTLDTLLRMCYPLPPPEIAIADLSAVLGAALEYVMDGVTEAVKMQMKTLAVAHPLRVYFIALRHNLLDEARFAAKCFLAYPVKPIRGAYAEELEVTNGGDYYRILNYHEKCGDAARRIASSDFEWVSCKSAEDWCFLVRGHVPSCTVTKQSVDIPNCYGPKPTTWWWKHMSRISQVTDKTPCGKAVLDAGADEALVEAAATQCLVCKPRAAADMRRFTKLYAAEVDRVTSEVKLEIRQVEREIR